MRDMVYLLVPAAVHISEKEECRLAQWISLFSSPSPTSLKRDIYSGGEMRRKAVIAVSSLSILYFAVMGLIRAEYMNLSVNSDKTVPPPRELRIYEAEA